MSDIRKCLLTPDGVYMQDEDGQGWTLLTKDEEEAALIDESMHHLTNEEAGQYYHYEIDMAKLHEAFKALRATLEELVRIVLDWIADLVPVVCQAIKDQCRETLPRPDYKARPKHCTRAKIKRHRKQRSRER